MIRSEQVHDAILRTHFDSFLRRSLRTLNPGQDYLPNWHIRAIDASARADSGGARSRD